MKHSVYFMLLSIFLFSSCIEEVDIKVDSTYERVVIEGYLTNEYKTHQVKISKSADYFSNKPAEPISGATVTINDGTLSFPLNETLPGIMKRIR